MLIVLGFPEVKEAQSCSSKVDPHGGSTVASAQATLHSSSTLIRPTGNTRARLSAHQLSALSFIYLFFLWASKHH